MKKLIFFFVAALFCAVPAQAGEPLKVVASFSILGDLVKNVGGEKVAVTTLVGPNQDAHVFEPRPADAKTLAEADLAFVNGLGFDGSIERLAQSSKTKAPVVIVSQGVKTLTMADEDHGGKRVTDPHAWQDIANGKIYVANIEKALIQADPAGREIYAANAKSYLQKLEATDAWVRQRLDAIPQDNRKIITSHEAFGYFGAAYGLAVLAPQGYSTESEASAKKLGALIRQIKQEKVKALFIETMTDPRMIDRIAKETGAKPGGALYSDALSAPDGPAPDYLDMFKNNVTKIVEALSAE